MSFPVTLRLPVLVMCLSQALVRILHSLENVVFDLKFVKSLGFK